MFEESIYPVEEHDDQRETDGEEDIDDEEEEVKNEQRQEDAVNDRQMVLFSNHTFKVSQGDQQRFPSNQFGYTLAGYCPFILNDFKTLLTRHMHLEAYCDAVDNLNGPLEDSKAGLVEPDLFQALFYPKSLAPRTPMKPVASTQMTEQTLSSMWFRLVAHYFEWLAGIPELQYMDNDDKLRLSVCQLCKVICFSVVYANYDLKNQGDEDLLFFGSGFYWDPARGNDPLMDEYCQEMKRIINQVIRPAKKVRMTKEEFVIVKLILLFDASNLMGISYEGLEFTRSMCCKYREVLSRYVECSIEDFAKAEGWSEQQISRYCVERMRALLDLPMGVEKLGKLDDDSLASMVESNYGGMRGTLQQQIHTESKKIRNH